MKKNRLALDFTLETTIERREFITEYLTRPEFSTSPPNEKELETIADYILWGKDPNTKKNVKQEKLIQLETASKTWDFKQSESLDSLIESPTFNESAIKKITSNRPKVVRQVFDRAQTLNSCPTALTQTFTDLFKEIDTLELQINFYELSIKKRQKPPREELLSQFTENEIQNLKLLSENWTPHTYLKNRHRLVELRREQYTLKDLYSTTIMRHTLPTAAPEETQITFDTDIEILPLGLKNTKLGALIFQPQIIPQNYTEPQLKEILSYYWKKQSLSLKKPTLNFKNLEDVYQLLLFSIELDSPTDDLYSTTQSLIETLKFYAAAANLTDCQREILTLKIEKKFNQDIADYINKKFQKTYTANYISTIFRQKIIPKINEAAQYHEDLILSLPCPEEFKTCTKCGRTFLRDTRNFVKKSRSTDGLSSKCKHCDKEERQLKKEEN